MKNSNKLTYTSMIHSMAIERLSLDDEDVMLQLLTLFVSGKK